MKLKRIIKRAVLALFLGLILTTFVAYWTSTNDCDHNTGAPANPMKAIVYCEYGSPDVLKFEDVEKPVPNDNQVLIKVRAASLNALTALQGLREGKIQPGQKVLINGATGGVGTFAVQIAKSFGAEVTAVCSTRNVELVRSIGADHVIDYTKEDFTKSDHRYDVIFDNVCNHSLAERRQVLNPKGICVLAGMGGAGVKESQAIGRIAGNIFAARGLSWFIEQKFPQYITKISKQDLVILADLVQMGKLKPVIERTYKLSEAPEALRYLNEGHARGKLLINVN